MKKVIGTMLGIALLVTAEAREYVVDPVRGTDSGEGSAASPWQSFAPLNRVKLEAGDHVTVHPGELRASLAPQGGGKEGEAVSIRFLPGDYHWIPGQLNARPLIISNTNDRPHDDKTIAMDLQGNRHLHISGDGAHFYCHGKMVQIHLDRCADIRLSGFSYDYARPTVSEYTATRVTAHYTDFTVHPDSQYRIENGRIIWMGHGWSLDDTGWVQEVDPVRRTVRRNGPSIMRMPSEEIAPGIIRVRYPHNPGFFPGNTYQYRAYTRDCCGVFCHRSSRIQYEKLSFHFMHGMGIVSQFSRDLTFDKLRVAPREGSKRTACAWADILHFSGCSGHITVRDSLLSHANDDAINVHGTHLRIMKAEGNKLTVRFMHKQTWGFAAFAPGDSVQFTSARHLRSLGEAVITRADLSADGREMTLEIDREVPTGVTPERDVLENVSATPSITVERCKVDMISTRGFLLTTRRPIIIRDTEFIRTGMPAILVENDANFWFESGPVHNMLIEGCRFDTCSEPVICFNPQNKIFQGAVHRNIRIENNHFELMKGCALQLYSTEHCSFLNNTFHNPTKYSPLFLLRHADHFTHDVPLEQTRNYIQGNNN